MAQDPMLDAKLLCDILCVIGYLEWAIIVGVLIYTIYKAKYDNRQDISRERKNLW